MLVAHQLQYGEEHADERRLVHGRFEERGERRATIAPQLAVDALHVDVNRCLVVANALGTRYGVLRLEYTAKRAHEVPQLNFLYRLRLGRYLPRRQIVRGAREPLAPLAAALFEHARSIAVLFVLEEPPHEVLPRVFEFFDDFVFAGQR